MWKTDSKPIKLMDGRWLGLCKHFDYCGNYIVRDIKKWNENNTVCVSCAVDPGLTLKPGAYRWTNSQTTKFINTVSVLMRELHENERAVKKGKLTWQEAYKSIQCFARDEIQPQLGTINERSLC